MMNFRYREKDTAIHRLNPLCKLAWVISIAVVSLIFDHPVYLVLLFLSTVPPVLIAGVGREWAASLKYTLFLCLVVVLINTLVSYHGAHIWWQASFRIRCWEFLPLPWKPYSLESACL